MIGVTPAVVMLSLSKRARMSRRVVSLGLLACLTLAACGGGGGSTPVALATTAPQGQTQTVALSTTAPTQIVSQVGSVSLATVFPANAMPATVSISVSTAVPSGAPALDAIAYMTVTSTSNIYVGLPAFTVTTSSAAVGASAYAAYTVEASGGLAWIDYAGPVPETTAPFTLALPPLPVSLVPAPTAEVTVTQPQEFAVYSK